jgi:hypothetical protein
LWASTDRHARRTTIRVDMAQIHDQEVAPQDEEAA